jgi:hypothetical protein
MWYCLPALELNAGFLDNDSAYKPDPGEKTFSPSSPKAGLSFLFRLSEPRFAYSLKITPVSCLAHARFISEPTDVLRSESAVCGLNGLRPASARCRRGRRPNRERNAYFSISLYRVILDSLSNSKMKPVWISFCNIISNSVRRKPAVCAVFREKTHATPSLLLGKP